MEELPPMTEDFLNFHVKNSLGPQFKQSTLISIYYFAAIQQHDASSIEEYFPMTEKIFLFFMMLDSSKIMEINVLCSNWGPKLFLTQIHTKKMRP